MKGAKETMSKMKWLVTLLGMDVSRGFNDDNFWTDCPCHKDEDTCLHVYKCIDGRIEMRCFACGARSKDICEEVGIPLEELEPEKNSLAVMNRQDHYAAHRWRCAMEEAKRTKSTPETWNGALESAQAAVIAVIDAITGDRQTASDQLVDSLVGAFADRLGSMVSAQLMRELAASTPPADKTDSAVGFEGSEKND